MSFNLYRTLKHQLSSLMARLSRRPRLTVAELVALRPGRILIVRQHNQMGDMVCATPAFRAIHETWPEAEIALVFGGQGVDGRDRARPLGLGLARGLVVH